MHIGVAPSLNVTLPVGLPAPGAAAVTVAVKVTDCPSTEGLTEDATPTELEALPTAKDNGAAELLLAVKSAFPV